jgi:hypothetical protein
MFGCCRYLQTNNSLWRTRALEQMSFWMAGQNVNQSDPNVGAVNTAYNLPTGPFNSDDRGNNKGWKIDLNAHMARYALLTYEAVLTGEGVAHSDWLEAARLAARWVYRVGALQAQRQGSGLPGSAGFPQKIDATSGATPAIKL